MSDDLLPMETLERLSRQEGVDTRPILVRVLTDLFIQKESHSQEEAARYEELVSQLLDVVDLETRSAVARRLAGEPRAPKGIIDRLIADDIAVSGPILSRFKGVPRETLLELALDGGVGQASAVASRSDVDDDMIRTLAHHADEFVIETLCANRAAGFSDQTLATLVERAARAPAVAAALMTREDLDAGAMAPLYLQAEPPLRARIRGALDARANRSSAQRTVHDIEALNAALVMAAAETGLGHLIAEALGGALGLKPDDAARLATEPSGEPYVLMLRAAGIGSDLVIRALLVGQPEIATSVVRFFHLVEIAETTSRAAAGDLVAALVGQTAKAAVARHDPLLEPSGVMERAGAARALPGRRRFARLDAARTRG